MTSLRDILNRARWRDDVRDSLDALAVHVVHRGAPDDRRVIEGARIRSIRAAGIELAPENDLSDPVFVPYHRFLAIVGADGVDVWTKGAAVAPTPEPVVVPEAPAPTAVSADFDVVLAREPLLVIDGSAGEGGGQILRTSLALAMATGTPFAIERIRAGRSKPGLLRQHLTGVRAASLVCGATVEGATLGSTRLVFRPGRIVPGDHDLDIGSAGSVSLVLQTIAFALARADGPSRITVHGGTHAQWAPAWPFLEEAWLPLVRRAGAKIELSLERAGFYPAGGGTVTMRVTPGASFAPLHLGDGGFVPDLSLHAVVAGLPVAIAERELAAAAELLGDYRVERSASVVAAAGTGNAMWLVARDEGTGIRNVFSGIGERGVRAEDVGQSIARSFLDWQATGASVEGHLADQLMLPIALAGAGSFTTNELTLHARTNIEVIHAFTGARLRALDLGDGRYRIGL